MHRFQGESSQSPKVHAPHATIQALEELLCRALQRLHEAGYIHALIPEQDARVVVQRRKALQLQGIAYYTPVSFILNQQRASRNRECPKQDRTTDYADAVVRVLKEMEVC